jgi:arylsulfotransferase ASST
LTLTAARRLTALVLGTGAVLASGQPALASGRDSGASAQAPRGMSFASVPGLHPPSVTVTADPDSSSGDIFLTPRNSYQRHVQIQHGPMILNSQGQLVWFDRLQTGLAADLEVQRYQGQPVLTWWQGGAVDRNSEDVIMDSSYRTLATLHAGHGDLTDTHEFKITPQNTALIAAVHRTKADLSSVGGPRHGTVDDNIVQELDIKTGRVLWEWHSYGHVPLQEAYIRAPRSRPFDYFHLNSIQQLPNGNLLVSARSTWAIYEISRKTGQIIWTLGGKRSSFTLGPGARFSWQHDARLHGHTLSLFDDASDGPSEQEGQSSAKFLSLDMRTMRATLVRRYTHSPGLLAVSQGNAQALPNGDVFVGWGADPEFSEYSPAGRQIFNGSFALGVNSYRAYRFSWTGRPSWPPAVAVSSSGDSVTISASWNGATEVAAWRVLGGDSPALLSSVAQATRTGFETTIHLTSSLNYFAVQALNAQGHVLGTSAVKPR